MSAREELVEKLRSILKQENSEWEFKGVFDDGVLFRKRRGFIHHDTMSFNYHQPDCIEVTVDDNTDYGYLVGRFKEDDLIKLVYSYTSKHQEYSAAEVLKKI